ncbi:MAG: ATP-binding protein [Candidatus Bathyarchaeum sp.]|nr:MAG: ATP-binding protein [Candidatus Bathyarchaeum sp.]
MSGEKAKTPTEKFELTVESKLESLPKIGEFLDRTMQHLKIQSSKDIYAVQLSVDEACTNIINHAYADKSEGKIAICCMLMGEKFVIDIMDWGKPFDPTTKPEPDIESGLDERKVGGLGIFFIRKYMDEVSYSRSDCMNLLTIVKYIQK